MFIFSDSHSDCSSVFSDCFVHFGLGVLPELQQGDVMFATTTHCSSIYVTNCLHLVREAINSYGQKHQARGYVDTKRNVLRDISGIQPSSQK